jgi:hypothetical protein
METRMQWSDIGKGSSVAQNIQKRLLCSSHGLIGTRCFLPHRVKLQPADARPATFSNPLRRSSASGASMPSKRLVTDHRCRIAIAREMERP